jgi:hypothetical protein
MIISDFSFLGKTTSSKLGNLKSNYFQFGSVFIKKKTKLNFFFKKYKSGQTDQFWFGSVFLGKNRFFRFSSVFPVWLSFFPVSVRFGFLLIKPKPNRTEPAVFF